MPKSHAKEYDRSLKAIRMLGLDVDLMRPLSPFALRMPHEVKEAARALSQSHFYEWDETGEVTKKSWGGGSINDVLNALLEQGLINCQPLIALAIDRIKADRAPFARMVAYLMAEPEAPGVSAADFPDDKEVRDFLTSVHTENDLPADASTWSRADLMSDISGFDRQLQNLIAAQKAVATALEPTQK